jgi:hypothetical protein
MIWKGDTSSDEVSGHMMTFAALVAMVPPASASASSSASSSSLQYQSKAAAAAAEAAAEAESLSTSSTNLRGIVGATTTVTTSFDEATTNKNKDNNKNSNNNKNSGNNNNSNNPTLDALSAALQEEREQAIALTAAFLDGLLANNYSLIGEARNKTTFFKITF